MRQTGLLSGLAALSLGLTSACSHTGGEVASADSSSALDWPLASPESAGLNRQQLAKLTQALRSNEIANVHAVLIEHRGSLVYEEYFTGADERWDDPIGFVRFDENTLHDLRSITKSVTSLLLGIALKRNYQSKLQRPLVSYFPDRSEKIGANVDRITLQDALTMRAGLKWKEQGVPFSQNDELRMYDEVDPIGMVLARPVVETPGTTWNYNGGLTQVLAGVIRREKSQPIDEFAEEALFERLGIEHYEWLGSPNWRAEQSASAASGLRLRPRDLAKIGSLMLNQGKWRGNQIVPREWIDMSAERQIASVPFFPDDAFGYGFMWYVGEIADHKVVSAIGNGEQLLFILPEDNLAITMLAGNYNNWNPERPLAVLTGVIAAIGKNSNDEAS